MSILFRRRLARALGALALAALNATLLLTVLATFFGWRLVATAERVTATAAAGAAARLDRLDPVAGEVAALRAEMAALRADLAAGAGEGAEALAARLDEMQARLEATADGLGAVFAEARADPGLLVDRAVTAGFAEAGRQLAALRGCNAAGTGSSPGASPGASLKASPGTTG